METKELMLHPWEEEFELPESFNMVSLLLERHLTGGRAERPAIFFQDDEVTYRQLGQMANQIGNGLIDLGVKPKDRVIILLYDRPEFVALFLAAMKIGAVPVPINILATTKDLEYFIGDSQASTIVMESEFHAKLASFLADAPHIQHVVVYGEPAQGAVDLSQLMQRAADQLDTYPTSKTDHSYWLYTSGTTGFPKAVIHLHKDLVYAVETWGHHVVDFKPEDRVFCMSKLFFSYGLNFSLYLPLYYGAAMVLNPERPTPETILALIERHRPTGLFSVPTAYGQMLNFLEEGDTQPDLTCLRFCISAGEALPGSLFTRWRDRFGIEIFDGLGSSEVSYIFISNRPGKVKENSSGLPLPGYQVEVRDEQSNPLPPCEVGELWVKSNTLLHGYWNQPEKTAETLVDGWMKTGDMGYLDAQGYFFFSARANDTMKVSGIWVSPLEVENTLLSHPAVAECAVVGVEDAMGLVKPKAFVTLKGGYQASDELVKTLQLHVKQNLAPHKYPRSIEFVDDLPKTSTGKIQRYKLREPVSFPDTCDGPQA
jgi:benzoate-CoA ligase family protein